MTEEKKKDVGLSEEDTREAAAGEMDSGQNTDPQAASDARPENSTEADAANGTEEGKTETSEESKPLAQPEVKPVLETPAATPVQKTAPPAETAKTPTPTDGFKPHYTKEARSGGIVDGLLYLLLAALGVGMIGLGVDVFLKGYPFRLETATTVLICLALIGLLWKAISLEVKVGLAAASTGILLGFAHTVYNQPIAFPGLPVSFVLPVFFILCLFAALLAIWKIWPRVFWLPIVLTVLVLYAALTPILALTSISASTQNLLLGPAFMENWLIYLRSGFWLAQVVLPLGAVFLLVLQVKILFKAQYETHWGFLFWGICLFAASSIGLAGLERGGQPVYPKVVQGLSQVYSATVPVPSATTVASDTSSDSGQESGGKTGEPSSSSDSASDQPVQTEPAKPADQPAPVGPETGTPAADTASTVTQEPPAQAPSDAGGETTVAEPIVPAQGPESSEPADSVGAAPSGDQASEMEPSAATQAQVPEEEEVADRDTAALTKRIETLERQIRIFTKQVEAQDRLIRAILDFIGTAPAVKPGPEPLTENTTEAAPGPGSAQEQPVAPPVKEPAPETTGSSKPAGPALQETTPAPAADAPPAQSEPETKPGAPVQKPSEPQKENTQGRQVIEHRPFALAV